MKCIHITFHYFDGWGYQENLLPDYQKAQGDDIVVVSGNDHLRYAQNKELEDAIKSKGNNYFFNGIKIRKIRYYINTSNTSFICSGLNAILEEEKPDMIFHHGLTPPTLTIAFLYVMRNPSTKLYVDNHADWINQSKNKIWNLLYSRLYLRILSKIWNIKVDRYLGVTPLRCKYLHKVYGIPYKKIAFLPIGCDTKKVNVIGTKYDLRVKFNIPVDAFVISSGGKMDRSKGTIDLIRACHKLNIQSFNIILILFGKSDDEVDKEVEGMPFIRKYGWCDRETTLSLLKLSDACCWPLLHTTLIEDSVACGIPLIIKSSGNVSHFENEGNGVFMKEGNESELIDAICYLKNNITILKNKAEIAKEKFSYKSIAKVLLDGNIDKYKY